MLCINITRDKCEECFIQLIQGLCFTSRPGIYSCCTQTCGLIVSIIVQLDEYKFRSRPHHGDEMVSRSIYRQHHRTEETMVGHMAATGCGHPCESAEGWLLHQAQSSSQQNTYSSSSWLSCHIDQVWVTHIRHYATVRCQPKQYSWHLNIVSGTSNKATWLQSQGLLFQQTQQVPRLI